MSTTYRFQPVAILSCIHRFVECVTALCYVPDFNADYYLFVLYSSFGEKNTQYLHKQHLWNIVFFYLVFGYFDFHSQVIQVIKLILQYYSNYIILLNSKHYFQKLNFYSGLLHAQFDITCPPIFVNINPSLFKPHTWNLVLKTSSVVYTQWLVIVKNLVSLVIN